MKSKHIQQVDFSNPNADKIISSSTVKSVEKKQTAVEWLVEQITNKVGYYSEEVQKEIYQQAKEMEKEQIVDAANNGCASGMCYIDKSRDGEQYYNETYKKGDIR